VTGKNHWMFTAKAPSQRSFNRSPKLGFGILGGWFG